MGERKSGQRGSGERKSEEEQAVRQGEGEQKETPPAWGQVMGGQAALPSMTQVPVFFLRCLVSWLKVCQLNGVLGTGRQGGL